MSAMNDIPPALDQRLAELRLEYDEGEITEKGYLKRRTALLQQFQVPGEVVEQNLQAQMDQQYAPSLVQENVHDGNGSGYRASIANAGFGDASPHIGSVRASSSSHGHSDTKSSDGQSANDYVFNPALETESQYTTDPAPYFDNFSHRANTGLYDEPSPYEEEGASHYDHDHEILHNAPFYSDPSRVYNYDQNPTPTSPGYESYLQQSQDEVPPWLQNAGKQQLPFEPREVPFALYDPHSPSLPMSSFDTIASLLRHRSATTPKRPAFLVLDSKGKEVQSVTWDKLAGRAEKVAKVIRDKSGLFRGDRVALVYRDGEVVDFVVALFGCFIAGVVAVPINRPNDYAELNFILTSTNAHLALTTDNNLKAFQRDLMQQRLAWPRGVEWWKTNEFGSYHPRNKKDDLPPLQSPDLAYIEFSRSPTGELRGVVLSHKTVMHQMAAISAMVSTAPGGLPRRAPATFERTGAMGVGGGVGEVLLTYLDPRQAVGMILGVLLSVYGGNTTVWIPQPAITVPGLWANLITKYKATLTLADYPGLKTVAYNYQNDPHSTRGYSKKYPVDFGSVRLCLIDCLNVDAEFHEILTDRWLRPLGNTRARDVVAPMLCLPEHGGMVISMRDWLGGQDRMATGLEEDKEGELAEVLLDQEALKTNDVVVVATGNEVRRRAGEPGVVRVGAFGCPIPDATMAIVDPENSMLCPPGIVGEIWVDSPSISGGFWALPKHTESIFHALTYVFSPETGLQPQPLEQEFLRTGLLGCFIKGKLYVLGLYEDRLRQRVEWSENGRQDLVEFRYHYTSQMVHTILRSVQRVFDCSAFDVFVNNEHLPVIILESSAAITAPLTPSGPPRQLDYELLSSIAEKCIECLLEEHQVRVYCVLITAPNTLPRTIKNGRREIGNMLCRREFEMGTLPAVHVKFAVERAVLNLPVGSDPVGGIWSPVASRQRAELLAMEEKQFSGVDYREISIDDRTSTPLNNFSSIVDLVQWRVSRQTEELALCSIDARGKEGKGISWRKTDQRIAAVATYIKNKTKIAAGDHVALIYTHSEEFVYAVHACFCLGVTIVPIAPLDQSRLSEDVPALLNVIADFGIKAILVNNDTDHAFKSKTISQHLRQSAMAARMNIPPIHNTSKPSKQLKGCRELGFSVRPEWLKSDFPALIWTYWTPDQRRVAVQLGHDTIMAMCKVQKETCQMHSARPILGCVRSTSGIGFMHTCLMGVYVGASTYIVSPPDYAANPSVLFQALARYKVKDTYATPQMLDHAMATSPAKGFKLMELKNLMIMFEGRPRSDIFPKVRTHFDQSGLDPTAVNTIYSHVLNPMVATRSYMCIEPVELYLDVKALRSGLVQPADPDLDPFGLLLHDSGMVPVSTQIAIVNPETCELCCVGEYGEIWIASEACAKAFYKSKDSFDIERFQGRIIDGDPRITYVRTGDLGFLHNIVRPIGPGGAMVDMQTLFVLGSIGETFEVNGLNHFPMDIEYSVERSHRHITNQGCAIFQAGGLTIMVIEVSRANKLAAIVPVAVNAVLEEHQVVVDVVAFVGRGDFPRSRLGEKQRGKILAAWVTRKLRTLAQFSVREGAATNMLPATIAENAEQGPPLVHDTNSPGVPTQQEISRGSSSTGDNNLATVHEEHPRKA
ncbi:hypothetical protein G7K_5305-t1 [Saitoella complicata NRRL Y-17804]|uniref:DMAP1-binding domain-containing protein n=2 Tax=Saitoella complicata (strain BCRC 22490 / CBS 7301 / JCM 7358 / NBRC 10748 / NRRL Y-17804) TaxID=698492 RepID=A0A0E9NMY3_SAICN|nr:hypothetical protein G7K_5305-t1 [Saitoella complicata NRRL Y-17804]